MHNMYRDECCHPIQCHATCCAARRRPFLAESGRPWTFSYSVRRSPERSSARRPKMFPMHKSRNRSTFQPRSQPKADAARPRICSSRPNVSKSRRSPLILERQSSVKPLRLSGMPEALAALKIADQLLAQLDNLSRGLSLLGL